MGAGPHFEIHEREEEGLTRISVEGELDLATAPALANRLNQLRADRRQLRWEERSAVRLDLSNVEFIDSTGIHVLFEAIDYASMDGWRLELEGDLSPQVGQMAKFTGLDRHYVGQQKHPGLGSSTDP